MLTRLKNELLDADPTACLPRNLSDVWLENLAASADRLLQNANEIEADASLVVAVLVRILEAKSDGRSEVMKVPLEEFQQYVERYRFELALEEVQRKTDISYDPATLETILTERDVTTWKKDRTDEDSSE